ncbi:MFS transporter [Anaerobiospirillum sp. NML120448]|uniref:MFS transporter n=1 Tax=Anaerobiospirillum sp. NML120448 TaxID=2932816 RepID=UPI001FF356A9|nr:MFS transporter [Anaerobiospirillum sp. NML120448]MCK0515236.1 MFS transporter [Anaerobiospirillum sp. NML120448]
MSYKGLIALAFGTLGLGIAEFVAMGLLPYWAADFNISLSQSGHGVSAYALGVAIGVFCIILMRAVKLKTILLLMIVIHIVGNTLTGFASSYETMLAARFIAGLPHGAYFGVGSIIAQRLASRGKGTTAIAIMIAGMTISNIFGVPVGTALAHSFTWRIIFYFIGAWGIIVLLSAIFFIRDVGKIVDNGFKSQFVFLKHPAPWLVLSATAFGNAGIFCMQSYISPILTDFASVPLGQVSIVMGAMGVCMVIANLVSGRLCDRYTPGIIATICQVIAVLALLGVAAFGQNTIACLILVCLIAGMLFAVGSPEQVSILRTAPGGLLLGASMIQAAFNLGNALGAYVGGIPLDHNMSMSYITVFGAMLTTIGALSMYWFYRKHEQHFKDLTQEPEHQNPSANNAAQSSMATAQA